MAVLPLVFTTSVSGSTLTLTIAATASYPDPIMNFDITLGYQTGIASYATAAGGTGYTVFASGATAGSVQIGGIVSDGGAGFSGGPVLATLTFTLPGSITDFPITLTGTALNNDAPASGSADPSVPCFAQGTSIATVDGEVAVEALRPGDLLRTAGGAARPVVWIGHRRVDIRTHPNPASVRPLRIAAGAFGPGRPGRDLFLSPDHALFVDGVLIPAKCLVNGASVAPVAADHPLAASVTYYHVELESHDALLAEGLPAESYLDTGNRAAFANAGAVVAAHPDFATDPAQWAARWAAYGHAPLVWDGPKLAAIRQTLLAELGRAGFVATMEPDLHLTVDRQRIAPRPEGDWLVFAVPAPKAPGPIPGRARRMRLCSRSGVPMEHGATPDERRLGVAIGAIRVDDRAVALDDPALGTGFWPVERVGGGAWRWTDGAASLDPALLSSGPGAEPRGCTLRVRLVGVYPSWLRPELPAVVNRHVAAHG